MAVFLHIIPMVFLETAERIIAAPGAESDIILL
jgi:hypothetical protein